MAFLALMLPAHAGLLVSAAEFMGLLDKKPPTRDLDSSFRALLDLPDTKRIGDDARSRTSRRRRLLRLGVAWACAVEIIVGILNPSGRTEVRKARAPPAQWPPAPSAKPGRPLNANRAARASAVEATQQQTSTTSPAPGAGRVAHARLLAAAAAAPPPQQYPCAVAAVRTPCYAVDLGIAQANADRMLATASALGVTVRPHVKTHKTVEVALLQTGGRRGGICVSTLAEAEFYAARGFGDLLYARPLTPDQVPACAALAARLHGGLIVCVDSDAQLDAILAHPPLGWPTDQDASSAAFEYSPAFIDPFSVSSSSDLAGGSSSDALLPAAAVAASRPWRIALLVDCGARREGLDPFVADERLTLANLAARVAACPWAQLHGVYTHGEKARAAALHDTALGTQLDTRHCPREKTTTMCSYVHFPPV